MQRRVGKAPAHISPPREKDLNGDAIDYDVDKVSRLNQKTLGLTNRIWIILAVFAFIVVLTRFILPPDPSMPRHGLTNANLRPKNYMNGTDTDPHPFDFCPLFGPGDEIGAKHGIHALAKSRVHLGSGARIQRVIHKALSGLPVTISVLGGSVSACHGAGDDPISPRCYPARFFQWWNTIFPHPASELTNGAMRQTNSAYFSYCNSHHLPDMTDLVILEFDVDDPNDKAWTEHFELLVRSILVRDDQPAVIILGHFSPQVMELHGFYGPEVLHNVVAQFYDVPHVSVKPTLYPSWINRPDSINAYFADPVLANPVGHELMAEVLIHYIESQICAAWSAALGYSFDVVSPLISNVAEPGKQPTDVRGLFGGIGHRQGDPGGRGGAGSADGGHNPHVQIPVGRINSRPQDRARFEEVQPFCVSANDLINPLPASLFHGSGWLVYHPPPGSSAQTVTGHYWYSTQPTSKLRVPIQVGAGDISIYYLKEPREDVHDMASSVECWVDDNYEGAKILSNAADVSEPTPTLEIIDRFVSRGSHFVECQLMGEEGQIVPAFRLLGIFSS